MPPNTLPNFTPDQLALLASMPNLDPASLFPRAAPPGETPTGPLDDLAGLHAELESARARSKAEALLGPEPIPFFPARSLIMALERERAEEEARVVQREKEGTIRRRTTYCGDEKVYSSAKVEDLKRINLREMRVRKVHRGRYLLVRVASKPSHIVALTFAAVDPAGDAMQVSLYNTPLLPRGRSPSFADVDSFLPVGAILLIKEPWVKMALTGSSALLRVDAPSDVLLIRKGDPTLDGIVWTDTGFGGRPWLVPEDTRRSFEAWKKLGNNQNDKGQHILAEKSYSLGIDQHPSHPQLYLLHLNRAVVSQSLERFSSALADAELALSLLTDTQPSESTSSEQLKKFQEKGLFRRCRALYSLRRWKDAEDGFAAFLALYPESNDASEGLIKTGNRLREASTGEYDVLSLYQQALSTKTPRLDVADFVGPVEVASLQDRGGGRGVIATRDVEPGELLLASKAFAVSYPEDLPTDEIFIGLNLLANRMDTPEEIYLRSTIFHRLTYQPELVPSILGLYPGPNFPSPPSTYSLLPPPPLPPHTPPEVISPSLVEAVDCYNSFTPQSLRPASFSEDDHNASDNPRRPVALFAAVSLFNHSCDPSASWTTIGDLQTIRAISPIPAGAEIFISYAVDGEYEARQALLGKHLPPDLKECPCSLCSDDRKDGRLNLKTRGRILEDRLSNGSGIDESSSLPAIRNKIKNLEETIRQLVATYGPHRGAFKPELYHAYQTMSYVHGILAYRARSSEPYKQVVENQYRALESIGVVVVGRSSSSTSQLSTSTSTSSSSSTKNDNKKLSNPLEPSDLPILTAPRANYHGAVCSAIQVAAAFFALEDHGSAKRWIRAAMWMEDVAVGGGKALFVVRYEQMLEELGLMRFAV